VESEPGGSRRCENDRNGFIKLIAKTNGTILASTIVAERAGETINEAVVAIKHKLKINDIAGTIHAYPTYSTGLQLLVTEMTVEKLLSGTSGRIVRAVLRTCSLEPHKGVISNEHSKTPPLRAMRKAIQPKRKKMQTTFSMN